MTRRGSKKIPTKAEKKRDCGHHGHRKKDAKVFFMKERGLSFIWCFRCSTPQWL